MTTPRRRDVPFRGPAPRPNRPTPAPECPDVQPRPVRLARLLAAAALMAAATVAGLAAGPGAPSFHDQPAAVHAHR